MSLEISQLFDQIDNVPHVPEVVKKLLSQVNDPAIDITAIAANIEQEQSLSLKILRAVNSSYYALPRKVGSINQALVILGMDELKKLILVASLINAIPDIPGLDIEDFWIDNFRTATYAKWIAEKAKIEFSDMIFTAGLINSLGNILIHLADSDTAEDIMQLIDGGLLRPEAERQYLGFTSQEACATLCRLWHFSEDLIDTVAKSGDPLNFEQTSLPACAVFIAKYISESNYNRKTDEERLAFFPKKEWRKIGLNEQDIAENMTTILELETGLEGLLD
ncbi:MAG: HDOD domain-containing protein [Piscirickettsiaceae bacterium]|nr:HDOD domain-containing protein [Piscirickettsiaceae bacterium]